MLLRPSLEIVIPAFLVVCLSSSTVGAQPCLMLVPELDQIVPAEAFPLTEVTLEGFGFQFGTCLISVTFGGTPSPSTQFIDAFEMIATVPDLAPGTYFVQVATVGGTSGSVPFTVLGPEPSWSRGDCNQDGSFNIADAVTTLAVLFDPGTVVPTCVDACDNNDDGSLDISDPIFGLAALFSGGPVPAAPHPGCGTDPTDDGIGCEEFLACP